METINRRQNPCLTCNTHLAGLFKGNSPKCLKCKLRHDYVNAINNNIITNIDYNPMDQHVVNKY